MPAICISTIAGNTGYKQIIRVLRSNTPTPVIDKMMDTDCELMLLEADRLRRRLGCYPSQEKESGKRINTNRRDFKRRVGETEN